MNRRLLFFSIGLLFVAGTLGVPSVATADSPQPDIQNCIQHERHDAYQAAGDNVVVSVTQTDNNSIVRYTFIGTSGDSQFSVSTPRGLTITNASGFEIDNGNAERDYNADRPWIEVSLGSPHANISYTASEQHAVVPTVDSREVELFHQPMPTGYAGAEYVLLGDYELGTAKEDCQRIRIVVPDSVSLPRSPDAYAESLATAGSDLSIGPKYRVVTGFVAPIDTGDRNGMVPELSDENRPAAEFYISPQARLTNPENTWLHEYIHTRQTTTSKGWVTEGSATYFTARYSVEAGWITPREYDQFFAQRATSNGTPDSANIRDPEYIRGAFFLMGVAEDVEDSNTTIENVYQEVNTGTYSYRRPESIDAGDFERAVESKTNRSVSYSNPMDKAVWVSYMVIPEWWPEPLKEQPLIRYVVTALFVFTGLYLIRGDLE